MYLKVTDIIELMDKDLEYCWRALEEVSRSFALPISKLPEITRDIYCVSYDICRIADTIEDSKEKDVEKKRRQLDGFRSILLEERVVNSGDFIERVNEVMQNSRESDLVENTGRIIRVFSDLPNEIKNSVKNWISHMIYGMKKFLEKEIKTFEDQDEYCYYVAGTVGNMTTEINYYRGHINSEEFLKLIKLSRGFGLGLQKVNIIKNVRTDFMERRRYWPLSLLSKQKIRYDNLFKQENLGSSLIILNELVINAQRYLFHGLEYTISMPNPQKEIRNYCLIPLFMAIATLSKCYNNPEVLLSEEEVKISREMVEEIVMKSEEYSQDNSKIVGYFKELRVKI